jgi:hypothetical protein
MPKVPHPLENQCVGQWSLEICPLSALLSPGFEHLERAVLSSSALDSDSAALRGDPLPMPGLPLQFRQFSRLQGKA